MAALDQPLPGTNPETIIIDVGLWLAKEAGSGPALFVPTIAQIQNSEFQTLNQLPGTTEPVVRENITREFESMKAAVNTVGVTPQNFASVVAYYYAHGINAVSPFSSGTTLSSGNNALASAGNEVLSMVKTAFTVSFGDFLKSANNILSTIVSDVGGIGSDISALLGPIASDVSNLAQIVLSINDNLLVPVTKVITESSQASTAILDAIHTDIHTGIGGLVKLPGDISSALTGLSAVMSRSQQELGMSIHETLTQVLPNALKDSGATPLADLGKYLLPEKGSDATEAEYLTHVNLTACLTDTDLKTSIDSLKQLGKDVTGLFGPLVRYFTQLYLGAWAMAGYLENQTKAANQIAAAECPIETLDPATTIEAVRRGIIADKLARDEMLKLGYDDSHYDVLYAVAQYLFSPDQIVELEWRQLIDPETAATLMDQNNLTPGQAQALKDMSEALLGTTDALIAWYRGIIPDTQLAREMTANHVNPDTAKVLEELALQVADPRSALAMYHYEKAFADGLLRKTLGTPPPEEIKKIYRQNLLSDARTEQDWLLHWDVPRVAWWITAYFRGIRTREEVYAAMDLWGVPEEIKDDIFVTEAELPPVWLVPDIVSTGVWSRDQAIPALKQLGFNEENATVLYNYGESKNKTSKAGTAADLQKLSLSSSKKLFDDGAIDSTLYSEILVAHGYSQKAAALTVELAQIEQAQTARKTFVTQLIDEVAVGAITRDNAETQLYNAQFSQAEVFAALKKIDSQKALNNKLPTRAELDKMLKNGVITQTIWLDTMDQLGYSQAWSEALLQII